MIPAADVFRRWRGGINHGELGRAKDFLDVTGPVHIKRSNGTKRAGAHRFRDGCHVVTVSTYCSVEEANQVLLHELAHAAQQERFGSREEFVSHYDASSTRNLGYHLNGFEVEARAASEFTEDFRIAK